MCSLDSPSSRNFRTHLITLLVIAGILVIAGVIAAVFVYIAVLGDECTCSNNGKSINVVF